MSEALRKKLTAWLENKIGDKIDTHISECLESKATIDVEQYAQTILEDVLNSDELLKDQEKVATENELGSEFSCEAAEEDFEDLIDVPVVSTAEFSSENAKILRELLQSFELHSVDEIVGQSSWTSFRRVLQDILVDRKEQKLALISLKVFQRLLASSHCPKAVCEGFTTLSESIIVQLDLMNKRANMIEAEDIYDIKDSKVYHKSSQRRSISPSMKDEPIQFLLRSMNLLLNAHTNVPAVWIRFNEKRLQDIVFSFVEMLAHSFTVEKNGVSGLDVVAILEPRANWCRHWTHGAISRGLLCQALRRHRRLFQTIVEVVLHFIEPEHKARRNSGPRTPNEEFCAFGVSPSALASARFCHCFSVIAYLVKYRAGRALFPLLTSTRKRPWTAHDMVSQMVDYIERVHSDISQEHTAAYKSHLLYLAKILLEVEEQILTARGTQRRI